MFQKAPSFFLLAILVLAGATAFAQADGKPYRIDVRFNGIAATAGTPLVVQGPQLEVDVRVSNDGGSKHTVAASTFDLLINTSIGGGSQAIHNKLARQADGSYAAHFTHSSSKGKWFYELKGLKVWENGHLIKVNTTSKERVFIVDWR